MKPRAFLRVFLAATLIGGQAAMAMAFAEVPARHLPRLTASRGRSGSRRSGRNDFNLALAMSPPLVRDALSRLLDTVPGFSVVGHGENEDQVRAVLEESHPEVLLLDYEAMFPTGESAISSLRRAFPKTRILVLARRSGDDLVERLLRAGASGVVGKQEEFETLVQAIHAVAGGEFWANRRSAARALERLTNGLGPGPTLEGLTAREQEVADRVALGLQNKEIARQLDITEATVKSHLTAIFRRLGITGRVSLAIRAQENGQQKD
jgi:DNA-binding NarL/FixJ family response regulator